MAFEVYNDEDYAQSLANLVIDGEVTIARNIDDKNLRKLLRGLSVEHRRMAEQLNLVANDDSESPYKIIALITETSSSHNIVDLLFLFCCFLVAQQQFSGE